MQQIPKLQFFPLLELDCLCTNRFPNETSISWQVSPAEVEGVLISHPDIEDAAVIPVPDPAAGELPKALVVKKPGTHITRQQIHAYVKGFIEQLSNVKGCARLVHHLWEKKPTRNVLLALVK